MDASYDWEEFLSACGDPPRIAVGSAAQRTAGEDFKLRTKRKLLAFINSGGIEKPEFINSKPWENNRNSETEILVDAYRFHSGPQHGYLAFFFNPGTGKWFIKSFKKNKDPSPHNYLFGNLPQLLEKGQMRIGGEL